MSWLDFFRRKRRVSEVVTPDDDRGWTRGSISGGTPLNPDRDELHGEALLNEAFFAYWNDPLAYAIIEQTTSFVLGGGAHVVAKDARVQRVIDRFWNDPENDMPIRIYSIQSELSIYGEQFIRYFVDPLTGRVVIRQLDPLYVTSIETSPNDLDHAVRYLYKPPRTLSEAAGGVAGEDETVGEGLGGTWVPAADVFHVAVNKPSGALRGRSDLAPILPSIRRYSEWADNRALVNKLQTSLLYDVTVTGASAEDITRLRALYASPPPPGTVLVHNEREAWSSFHSNIDAGDASADGRALRLMVCTGAVLPEHFLAEGGNANRATAAEMGLPAFKRFKRRQQLFRAIIARIINRVLDEGVKAGRLGPRVDRSFTVQLEEISDLPPASSAETLKALSEALGGALGSQLITKEEARQLWLRFANLVDDSAPAAEEAGA